MNYSISLQEASRLATENLSKMPKPTLALLIQRWEMVKMKSEAKNKNKIKKTK